MLRSVSRVHNFDLSEKYTYHLQRGETFHLVKRDRYHLHIRVILKALKHFHVVLRMLHLQVWDMLPSMFHFLSKILVEIMVVLWCHNFLLYLTECCALQHQRFSPSLKIYIFFPWFSVALNMLQYRSRVTRSADFPFWNLNCFVCNILCLSMKSISLKYISFSNILPRIVKMEIGQ